MLSCLPVSNTQSGNNHGRCKDACPSPLCAEDDHREEDRLGISTSQISALQSPRHAGRQQSCRGAAIPKACEDFGLPLVPPPGASVDTAAARGKATAAGGKKRRLATPAAAPNAEVNDRDYYCKFLASESNTNDEDEELSSVRSSKRAGGHSSHSSVEKRRRDRINTLIDDLAEFVPPANTKYNTMKGPGVRRPKHTVLSDTLVLLSNMRKAMESSEQRIAALTAAAEALKAGQGSGAAAGAQTAPLPPNLPPPGFPTKIKVEQEQADMAWDAGAARTQGMGNAFGARMQPLLRLAQQQQHGSGSDLSSSGTASAGGSLLDQHTAASLAMFSYDTDDGCQDALQAAEDPSEPLPLSSMLLIPGGQPSGLCPLSLAQLDAEAGLDALAAPPAPCPMLLALTSHEEPEVATQALDWLDWMSQAQPAGPAPAQQSCKVI